MRYRVVITDEALARAEEHLRYLADQQQMPLTAQRWWDKVLDKIATLETLPQRCPHAPENDSSQHELRMLIIDNCLFIYHIDEELRKVEVVKFRHGRQLP